MKTINSRNFSFGFFSSLILASAVPTVVNAQEDQTIEEMVITGSRIARPNLSQPTPITTLNLEDIQVSGSTDLGRQLSELPALGSTRTLAGSSNSFSDSAGLNLADLRRLGEDRTLTLVNGKRHVGGQPGTTAVDLNSIPTFLVDRVEIVTGGASAVYGSDAVSGVINIVLLDDFEGFQWQVQGGQSFDGGYAETSSIDLSYGQNFAGGDGNFTVSASHARLGDVQTSDLDFADNYGTVVNPANTGEEDGIPDRLLMRNVVSEVIDENGVLFPFGGDTTSFSNSAGVIAFDQAGNPLPQVEREFDNSFAFGTVVGGQCDFCFELEDYITIIPEFEQSIFNTTARFDFTDSLRGYVDAKYIKADITENLQPSFNFGDVTINVDDNPYLNNALRTELQGLGVTDATLARFHGDNGGRINEIERETMRIVTGLEGTFETNVADFSYDLFYNQGKVENDVRGFNRRVPDNFQQALDAIDDGNGNAVCRDQSPGVLGRPCVPFNPFGQQNTADALAFSFISTRERQELTQKNAGFTFVTDSRKLFELPGGPIDVAGGIEWRREESATDGDPIVQADLTESAAQPDEVGGFEVGEYFVELSLPLVRDVLLVRSLRLDLAYRDADYTHAGKADASKAALTWAPFNQLTFRGTYGKAVRAPSITEAFSPVTPGFSDVDDPCDINNIGDDPDRAANCAALGLPPNFDANDNVSVDSESRGNPDLFSEESTSTTYGFIYQPIWAEGLSLTVDVYDIEIDDAITLVEAQSIVDNCVDASGGPDFSFCNQFTRDPVTQDIDFVRSTFINASALETEGVDVQITYDKALADWTDDSAMEWLSGNVKFSFTGNYLRELDVFEFQNRPDEINIERGEIGDPIKAFRSTLSYQHGDVTVGWVGRYIGNQKRYDIGVDGPEDTSPFDTGTVTYQDLFFRYFLPFDTEVELYGGINNVTDKEPPIGLIGVETNEAIYDPVGRSYFIGVRGRL